jgi:LPXTG-motif cell wall-anchored protein
MAFENLDLNNNEDLPPEGEGMPPEESGNRTFLVLAGILAVVALVCVAFIAIYALVVVPRSRNAQAAQRATLNAQNTQVALIIDTTSTSAAITAMVAAYTATPTETPVPPTPTATSTPTPVLAVPTTAAPMEMVVSPTIGPDMITATALHATLEANATLYAATLTAKPGSAQAQATKQASIPKTGFADSVGLPLMIGMAVALIAIIFLARRLRSM